MKKLISVICILLSVTSHSQDTLFNKKLQEVTIKSVPRKTTDISVINTVRNLTQVSDGISIEFIKKTPDRNVADALRRINGVTIQNDKFVLIRGLADRYNLAIVNNTLLPSTEPDRRAFSFDILPTNMIDNILVYKSASANLPGDFSGGLIQVTTREVSDNFLNVTKGIGFGTLTTFNQFSISRPSVFPNTFPSTYKFRVATNGDKRLYTGQIDNYAHQKIHAIPNLNGGFSFGLKKDKFNMVFTSSIRDSWAMTFIDRKDYQSSTELAYNYRDTLFTKRFSTSALTNLTYLDGTNKFSLKTIVNFQRDDGYLTRNGDNFDNVQTVRSNSTNHLNTFLVNSQFEARLPDLDINIGYNYIFREQPDYRVNPLAKSLSGNEQYQIALRDTYRFWSVMDEHSGNFSVTKKLDNFKIGGGYLKKYRTFNARVFRYTDFDILDEITNNTDKYNANFDLANSWAMWDKQFGKWKLNTGVRGEFNLFNVSTADFNGQKINVERQYLDALPSLNVSYNLDKTKLRLSASKTLARPEFREVANFAYYDFVRNAQILGNSKLEKTDIYNLDLKWETYPKTGENISVSLFGKNFIRPIEQIVADGSVPSNLLLTFSNPNSAFVYGLEFEWRKKISSWLDAYTNLALINSQVEVNGVKRQLQGQSNYVINGGLNFKKDKNTVNLTYNRVGDRISAVGFQGYPDIFENSRDIVDITILRKVKNGEIKLSLADIFRQPSIYYQKAQNRQLIKFRNEATISIGVSLNL